MKRILQISLQKIGGGAADALEWSNALCENNTPHQAIISDGNELIEKWENNTFRTITVLNTYTSSITDFLLKTLLLYRPLILIKKVIHAKPNTVLVTHFHPWIVFILWCKIFLRFRLVYAVHEDPFSKKENTNWLFNLLERFFFISADIVVAHSKFLESRIKNRTSRPIWLLPLGSYPSLFPNFSKVSHTDFRLLFLGRVEPYKGVDTLLEAVEKLQRKSLDIKLTIAGRGNLDEQFLQKIKTINAEILNQWVDYKTIGYLLSISDTLVLPYKTASQSGVGGIGLTCGIPMIGSSAGGIPEQIKDGINGLIFEAGNPDDLASKIETIYNNRQLLEKFRDRALHLSTAEFNWKINVGKFVDFLEKL